MDVISQSPGEQKPAPASSLPSRREGSRAIRALKRFAVLYLLVLVGTGGFISGMFYGEGRDKAASPSSEQSAERPARVVNADALGEIPEDLDFNLFWDVWNEVRANYVRQPVSERDLFYGALRGMVAALDDPYSVFLEPQTANEFGKELKGTFDGIGAEIGIKQGQLQIVAPLPDSPAERAGLRPGDRILAIDGTDTTGMAVDEAVSKIRGEKGTVVTLVIYRGDGPEPFDVQITRSQIVVKSVNVKMETTPGGLNIGIIEIRQFNEETTSLFDQAVREVLGKNPAGVILNLRNNPGGYLDAAVDVAGEWVKEQVVVKEKTAQGNEVEFRSDGRARFEGLPTVVLINQGSASGAEIVAGALQDLGAATLVGMKTFGKGSVQDFQGLPDGSALKLTIAEWLTPKGRSINQQGIDPDLAIDLIEEDYNADRDPQLEAAFTLFDARTVAPLPGAPRATSTVE